MQQCKPTTQNAKITFSTLSLEINSTVSFLKITNSVKKLVFPFIYKKLFVLANKHIFLVL